MNTSHIAPALRDFAVPIEELFPVDNNPNQGDVGNLVVMFTELGQQLPIIFHRRKIPGHRTKQRVVIVGNHRLYAAQHLGWDSMAAIEFEGSVAEADAFGIGENRSRDLASTDHSMLAEVLVRLREEDERLLMTTGYDSDDIDVLLSDTEVDWDKLASDFPDEPAAEQGIWRRFSIALPPGLYESWCEWFESLPGETVEARAQGWVESLAD